jgi:hypothetical protein
VHRQHEHAQLGHLGVHLPNKFYAVAALERQVDHDDIGLAGANRLARYRLAVRLAANREVRLRLEHAPQALPHDRVVVDDENLALGGHRCGHARPLSPFIRRES